MKNEKNEISSFVRYEIKKDQHASGKITGGCHRPLNGADFWP